jgi:hypothetical protein
MSTTNEPNVRTQIIQAIYEHGPKNTEGMTEFIKGVQEKTIQTKALELLKEGQLTRDADMVYSLAEGVSPQTFGASSKSDKPAGSGATVGAPLDARGQFEALLKSVAVKPPEVIPTLAQLFFSGDIDDLKWLAEVLKRHGAGWVVPNQIRLVISTWSKTRGLPFNESEFDIESGEGGKGAKAEAQEPKKTGAAKVLEDAGIGWKVGKDRDGDWVAMPGGGMTQEEATAAAERRATIAAMRIGEPETMADEPSASGEGKPAAKGARPVASFQDKLMDKVLDAFIEGKTGRDGEDSPVIKELRQQNQTLMTTVQQMKDQQDRDWRERIEANIAAMAANDPWSDPVQVARIRQAIGYQSSPVTDSSPAVQLIKDSTDKMDKNVGRLTGIIERMVLQGDVFRPEETRTAAEKESKAGDLLQEAAGRQRSIELRKRAFQT